MNPMVAVATLLLKTLSNDELAAANNAIQSRGCVLSSNIAFDKLRKLRLIEEDGRLCDSEVMKDACAIVVNDRVEAGTFV